MSKLALRHMSKDSPYLQCNFKTLSKYVSEMAGRFLSDFSGDSGSSESSEGEDDLWMDRSGQFHRFSHSYI